MTTTSATQRATTRALLAAFYILHSTFFISVCVGAGATAGSNANAPTWRDPSLPIETRVNALVSQLTLKEKISQIGADPLAIPRLGIPAYSHRNECLHGIQETDSPSTVFPEPIGMAATWNAPLIQQEADAIATEARAKYNDYAAKHDGNVKIRYGLTFYTPNINIFRDPRWGRGQETYGEDPFLTAQIGLAFINGLQGDDPRYMKIMACAKHFAVHSGPEKLRHQIDMNPPERDFYETYLPAFETAVREGRVGSVMGVYSSLYGTPGCANKFLIHDILRDQWGFDGVFFSDGGAIWDIWGGHHYKPTPEECVAAALRAGCDVASGNVREWQIKLEPDAGFRPEIKSGWPGGGMNYNMLQVSLEKNLVTEAEIDRAVRNELTSRFRVGMFDPPEMVPWSKLTLADSDTPAHRALALKIAEQSIVLLKNDGILPLDRAKYKRIAVIGPNANSKRMLLGNYEGTPSSTVTILDGIRKLAGETIEITHERAVPPALKKNRSNAPAPAAIAKALAAAESSDLVIFVSGIDGSLECEEVTDPKKNNWDGFDTGDRTRIELPAVQEDLIKKLHALGKPLILVNCSGCAMAMPWEAQNLPAIVQAWYPGQDGGLAVARVLFGEVNPAGRLPITFYESTGDLPDFQNYSMENRTYRYFTGKPLYAFGHGLSYTTFAYKNAAVNKPAFAADDTIKLTFDIANTGSRDGDEVPQVYFRHVNSAQPQAKQTLCGFTRVTVPKGAQQQVTIEIPAARLRYYDTAAKRYTVEPGQYELLLAAASDDIRATVPFSIKAPDKEFFDGAADPASKEVMRQAETDIEKYRKGDFTITLTDETGAPIPATTTATLDLTRHQFIFGCSMFKMSRLPDDDPMKKAGTQALLDIFNQVVVVDHWYNPFGEVEDKQPDKDVAWAVAHAMRMRVSPILYEEPREAIGKHLTQDQYWQMFEDRIKYMAAITGGKPQIYDVINEVISRKRWNKNNPDSFYRLVPDYPDLSRPDLIVRAYALARKYLPNAKLTALENGFPSPTDKNYKDIITMWKAALDAGADIDHIGTQCHFFDDGQSFRPEERKKNKDNYTMSSVSQALDMQKALNKPIEIAEFTGPSRNKLKSDDLNKTIWTMSEAENSAWQINFYKLAFSKPYIIGVTRWNLIDSYCGRAKDGGILTETGEKHQIYYDLRKLIKETWHTRVTQPPDAAGTLAFRGFYGDYQITAEGYAPAEITLTSENQNIKVILKKK